jgi:hypothetical protein
MLRLTALYFVAALGCYALAWVVCFVLLVGFEPSLAPRYFLLGWTFSGLELPSFVWLLSWPVFVAFYLAVHRFLRPVMAFAKRAV